MSPAGERLKLMTGVAAILRYPLPGIDDIEEDEEDDSDDESNKDPNKVSEQDESISFSNPDFSSQLELGSQFSDSFEQQCIDGLMGDNSSDDGDYQF